MKFLTPAAIGIILLLCVAVPPSTAQDIASYTIHTEHTDVFTREVASAMGRSPMAESLPGLGCSVEYIRRLDGDEIVYRRGPIDMHLQGEGVLTDQFTSTGTRPASESDGTLPHFYGGILVDLPRPGESGEPVPLLPERYRYMLRTALIPLRYDNGVLTATILLERAVVEEQDDELSLYRGELFSREVELTGNLPLKFDLPEWDSRLPSGV